MNGAQLTLWLPDSPVNRPVLRVSAEVRMMLDGSGRKSRASFAPARPDEAQYDWEAPRTLPASDRTPGRAAKLKALGNAVVPQQVLPLLLAIAETWMQMGDAA